MICRVILSNALRNINDGQNVNSGIYIFMNYFLYDEAYYYKCIFTNYTQYQIIIWCSWILWVSLGFLKVVLTYYEGLVIQSSNSLTSSFYSLRLHLGNCFIWIVLYSWLRSPGIMADSINRDVLWVLICLWLGFVWWKGPNLLCSENKI